MINGLLHGAHSTRPGPSWRGKFQSLLINQERSGGEEILIDRAGKLAACLTALASGMDQPRPRGLGKGRFTLPQDFGSLHGEATQSMFETRSRAC